MNLQAIIRLFALALAWSGCLAGAEEYLTTVSTELSPRVAFGAERKGEVLELIVEADAFGKEDVSVKLRIAAEKKLIVSGGRARISQEGKTTRWVLRIPRETLMDGEGGEGWKKLRFAFAVEWAGGPFGQPRQRERFLHLSPAAAHAELSEDLMDWQPLDLVGRAREAADKALEIAINFNQPLAGKATVVIENDGGSRMRNLVSGQTMAKGAHRLVWDGLDEEGNVVPPGNYRWRSISHPGLAPVHLMDFCDAPGSNHGTMQSAATNGRSLFFASPVAEGGWEIIELAPDGNFRRGFNPPNGHGLGKVAIAADEHFLYAAHDGLAWGEHVDRSKTDWKEERTISVMRIDLATGQIADFPDKVRHSPLRRYEAGPGSASKRGPQDFALAGITLLDGKLYLADRDAGKVLVVAPETGSVQRDFALPDPVAISSSAGTLYAIARGKLLSLDPASGKAIVIAAPKGTPAGLHVDDDGHFYISDAASHVVHVLNGKGKEEKLIGTPGGIAAGPYDPQKLQNPAGLAVLEGRLWVAERDRWQPKRLAAFDIKTGAVTRELFGPTNYGAQGAGFDELDPGRWLGQGAQWKLDLATGMAKPVSILGGKSSRRHSFWRQDGRTFVITSGKATWIQELRDDGTLHPLACISSAHQFSFENEWIPPEEFVRAFNRDYPAVKYEGSKGGVIEDGKPGHGYGMLWVDRNGDEKMEAEEIEFATTASSLAGSGWSHDFHDLTLRVPAEREGKAVMVTLAPDGFWPGGAPRYPALNDAVRAAVPIDLPGSSMVESMTDRFGNLVLNSDPAMRAVSADGKLLWTYPNRWSNVHGSHNAPLPKTGELQGSLFYSGVAPLDEKSDVFVINGNHGRAFVMTSDGMYLDEMFPDVRMMTNPQAGGIGILGGECFGGTFGRAKDGDYYFQGGGISYRIYRVDGLRQTVRSEGKLSVSGPQSIAASSHQVREAASAPETAVAKIPSAGTHSQEPVVKWDRDGKFPVSVKASWSPDALNLRYEVTDASPWINNGKDWQMLFKTGDGVDFQLGTDPTADPHRSGPVPGDLRLFIAPMGEENVVVLYRHRLPGAAANEAVNFQSPWRSEKVDSVRRLEPKVTVQRQDAGYSLDVSVPLKELGLEDPAGSPFRGDFGVIYGDAGGTIDVFRNYRANRATGLVNDVPGEIMLSPNLWGEIRFEPPTPSAK